MALSGNQRTRNAAGGAGKAYAGFTAKAERIVYLWIGQQASGGTWLANAAASTDWSSQSSASGTWVSQQETSETQ